MAVGADEARRMQHDALPPVTLGWFLKRTVIGIAILMVAMGSLAWLTYASIEPDDATATKVPVDGAAQIIPIDL